MKNIKIFWDHYQYTCVDKWLSPKKIWNNISNTDKDADLNIYVDSKDVPAGSCILLVEPRSIHPYYYDYVASNVENFSIIASYDFSAFNHLRNFTKISPPFNTWIEHEERKIYDKTKNISFIASTKEMCKEHVYRQKMVAKYQNACDLYGSGRKSRQIDKKIDGLKNYRFSFCMENYITELYYTEKILDCFLTGTIPIYYGTDSISKIFDVNGLIFIEDLNAGRISINDLDEYFYMSKIEHVKNNFNIANSLNNCIEKSIDQIVESTT